MIPYGNAYYNKSSGVFHCQHGELECELNTVFACAVHLHPRVQEWFPFVACVEDNSPEEMKDSLDGCAKTPEVALDITEIKECAAGALGEELERKAGQQTDSLVPRHEWVPWVTVNGIALWDDGKNLKKYVCAAYTGARPSECFAREEEPTVALEVSLKAPKGLANT
eukprot:CAMPEP_0177597658 /NCGR_PEP_ID=MMETSP0419_2-20121207/11842_1 /TAXON_ID=582737 /ORGANISM="Tetraselmis sp., Strain GSL018" /LENGTH=166 /DNA_ID=CAMNT_0019089869 /DNA_START=323 /DNA_END=823 /DNA_ORIENTATION=+